jgi:hypothetical protein
MAALLPQIRYLNGAPFGGPTTGARRVRITVTVRVRRCWGWEGEGADMADTTLTHSAALTPALPVARRTRWAQRAPATWPSPSPTPPR